ncbi:hypothetical protein V5N11_030128 [Cardamine amara subsp. amara]|uniref:Uncharacterized protein n=1 Tax=Cardamine amara subsp. amara TaxID=228776 RepID=A0ABD0ZN47_CARAN
MLTIASCFPTRWSRYVFFLLCSPLLLPLLCFSIPLLCAVEIFSRILKSTPSFPVEEVLAAVDDEDDLLLRRCEEGFGVMDDEIEESVLLQRYLDDQLILAISICKDKSEDDGDHDRDLIRVPLLS